MLSCSVGEFWWVYSPDDDIGIQVRHWGSGNVALIGAVAVKVGDSVITISVVKSATWSAVVRVRVDGQIITASNGQSIDLTDQLLTSDVSVKAQLSDSVTQLSFEYRNGHTLSVVCYSSAFCGVTFKPSQDFTASPAGLAGTFNGDRSDDFSGPDGHVYESVHDFGESWRILEWREADAYAPESSHPVWIWDERVSNFNRVVLVV